MGQSASWRIVYQELRDAVDEYVDATAKEKGKATSHLFDVLTWCDTQTQSKIR